MTTIKTWEPLRKWAKDAANGKSSKIPYIDIVSLIDENAELRAALQAQQGDALDAARYRWLREKGYGMPKQEEELDAAVDAARLAARREG